ncbi:alpha/beta fold hydrolase [Parasphingopyxis sp.]|uniref:alpha/beta fold hydrolase n=1 Tax=Parasphingopyxis sp. TaxID=1920299 RepID=UPI00261F1E25|nr:alpha/beta fold hydrolase [Parasphingopyxis sp.]
MEETEDQSGTDPSELAVDLEIVANSYRLASDEGAFHDLLAAWEKKLSIAESRKPDATQIDPGGVVSKHLHRAREVIAKLHTAPREDALDEAVSAVASAAIVLTPRCIVAAANAAAGIEFAATQGKHNSLEWIDPTSIDDFKAVQRSASNHGNRRHAIIWTIDPQGERGLAEAYVLEPIEGHASYIVVRSLETGWASEIDTVLEQAFGLTQAEREVAKLLHETCDSGRIADRRETSIQTVRTQVREILDKTGTNSQVELIRLLGLLSARASHGERSENDRWRDPWGHEQILIMPNGNRLAYSWTGSSRGQPAVLIHGNTLGYILGERIERDIREARIKLYAISRPGFGRSQSDRSVEPFAEHCDAIEWFMDRLELSQVTGIALGSGSPMLLAVAARRPDLFSRLLITGMLLPFDAEQLANLTFNQRIMFNLARTAPRAAELIAAAGARHIYQKGPDWFLQYGWGKVPAAQRAIKDPEIAPIIRNACLLTMSGGPVQFVRELRRAWFDYRAGMKRIQCPVHHIKGVYDRSVSAQKAKAFAAQSELFSTETFDDAGYFLPYERPDIFSDRLIRSVKG